ncbi:hypothetical protein [Burkholderia sp. BCC1993]|uniref:hypothetical protein n=1 Tax=Burkholderia sp. BCC1993 TaxID=2817444 RepID=UPI002AB05F3A|nr:hypothetical protein [Burkholderia sp. BCC1993]
MKKTLCILAALGAALASPVHAAAPADRLLAKGRSFPCVPTTRQSSLAESPDGSLIVCLVAEDVRAANSAVVLIPKLSRMVCVKRQGDVACRTWSTPAGYSIQLPRAGEPVLAAALGPTGEYSPLDVVATHDIAIPAIPATELGPNTPVLIDGVKQVVEGSDACPDGSRRCVAITGRKSVDVRLRSGVTERWAVTLSTDGQPVSLTRPNGQLVVQP